MNKSRGFTMMELLVTVVVAAILASVAVPAFNTFVQNDKLLSGSNSLVYSLNLARGEAIKQDVGGGVTVCASANGTTCGGTWAQGWIVLSAAGGAPVLSAPALPASINMGEASGLTQVTFLSTGTTSFTAGPTAAAFTMCDSRGPTFGRYVQVTAMGRVASSVGQTLNGGGLVCP